MRMAPPVKVIDAAQSESDGNVIAEKSESRTPGPKMDSDDEEESEPRTAMKKEEAPEASEEEDEDDEDEDSSEEEEDDYDMDNYYTKEDIDKMISDH